MLLTITNTTAPTDDLGFLLHKHPARCQHFDLAFGQAHVFYPEAASCRFRRTVRFLPGGTDDPEVGPPTQMGVFEVPTGGLQESRE
jgi:hypothetical protein